MNNIACMPLAVKQKYDLLPLIKEIDKINQGKGSVILDSKEYNWQRTELCLHFETIDYSIPTNWEYNSDQIKKQNLIVKEETQKLISYIVENVKITPSFISIIKSCGTLPAHFDITPSNFDYIESKKYNEPALLKMLFEPQMSVDKLFFTDGVTKKYFTYENCVSDTNLYAWSNTVYKHGVDDSTQDISRYIVNIYGNFDNHLYEELLKHSKNKYKSNCIFF